MFSFNSILPNLSEYSSYNSMISETSNLRLLVCIFSLVYGERLYAFLAEKLKAEVEPPLLLKVISPLLNVTKPELQDQSAMLLPLKYRSVAVGTYPSQVPVIPKKKIMHKW